MAQQDSDVVISTGQNVRTVETQTPQAGVQTTKEQQVVTLADSDGSMTDFVRLAGNQEAILLQLIEIRRLLCIIANQPQLF